MKNTLHFTCTFTGGYPPLFSAKTREQGGWGFKGEVNSKPPSHQLMPKHKADS